MNINSCYFCPSTIKLATVELNVEALKPIVAMADSHDLAAVLENFRTPFNRVATFNLMPAKVPGLKVYLDFGHANMGADNHEVFCRQLGRHIKHVHFSDNRPTADGKYQIFICDDSHSLIH